MKEYLMSVQVMRTYNMTVEAESEAEAYEKVNEMQTTELAEKGSLQTITVEQMDIVQEVDMESEVAYVL